MDEHTEPTSSRQRGEEEERWHWGLGRRGAEGRDLGRAGTRARAGRGRHEEHGGERIGLARKMGEPKEDKSARLDGQR